MYAERDTLPPRQAVLFIISLDDYHRNDGNGRNRLMESRELLLTICRSSDFLHLPLVLIFNKADLFNHRLNDQPLSTCSAFENVPGKGDAEAVEDYKKRSLDTVTEVCVCGNELTASLNEPNIHELSAFLAVSRFPYIHTLFPLQNKIYKKSFFCALFFCSILFRVSNQ
jgi:hypothetical protein